MKYLIADDDPFVCEQIESYLTRLPDTGYCLRAGDGLVALRLLATGDFDAAFLDLQMPHLDGVSVLRALPRRLPVVVVSASEDMEAQVAGFDLIASLRKPLDFERVLEAVQKVRATVAASTNAAA